MTRDFLARDFRANPLFELVLWDRLAPEEREALAGPRADPDLYGVLRPRPGSGLRPRSADRETALLFLTLREPGPLPAYVQSMMGVGTTGAVARLVADGVLEVEREGVYVWGPAALEIPAVQARGRLARLSIEALRFAQALPADDPGPMAARLYGYNGRPMTPAWKRRWPSPEAVEERLGIAGALGGRWIASGRSGWLSWRAREAEAWEAGTTWKLYVSPAPEALEGAFGDIAEALARGRAARFKIGPDAAGLLRPDKIVAYFPSFERLGEAAGIIAEKLTDIPAQGVPFTSEIAGEGLLSWGLDPPATRRGESWRFWLVQRLAVALLAARAAGAAEPWGAALERIRLEGVDVETWTPGARVWEER